jgi:GR25 family glycosyltransferase involved in LPS biosynthesis
MGQKQANSYISSDYIYVVKRCLEETNAPYIAVFEDDVIFAEDWMARTLLALEKLKKHDAAITAKTSSTPPISARTRLRRAPTDAKSLDSRPWIYLRLFYTETALGWNPEIDFWYGHYKLAIILASATTAAVLFAARASFHRVLRPHLDIGAILVFTLIAAPAFTALVFMAGKYSVWVPLQTPDTWLGALAHARGSGPVVLPTQDLRSGGIVRMNRFGCCTQGMVFPRSQVPGLLQYLTERHDGQTDSLIEEYSDHQNLNRYAVSPQVIQHVGLESSRGNTLINALSTWAFWFEDSTPSGVAKRHKQVLQKINMDYLRS